MKPQECDECTMMKKAIENEMSQMTLMGIVPIVVRVSDDLLKISVVSEFQSSEIVM
jgi:hypothetical protein